MTLDRINVAGWAHVNSGNGHQGLYMFLLILASHVGIVRKRNSEQNRHAPIPNSVVL